MTRASLGARFNLSLRDGFSFVAFTGLGSAFFALVAFFAFATAFFGLSSSFILPAFSRSPTLSRSVHFAHRFVQIELG